MPSKQINLSVFHCKVNLGAYPINTNSLLFYINLYVYLDIVLVNRKFYKTVFF